MIWRFTISHLLDLLPWRRKIAMPAIAPALEPPPVIKVRPPPDPEEVSRRLERRKLYRLREQIAADANAVLDAFNSLSVTGMERLALKNSEQCLSFLSGVDFLFLDHADSIPGGSEWCALNPDGDEAEFAETVWPLNYGAVTRKDNGVLRFTHVRSVDAKELRGKVKLISQKMVLLTCLDIGAEGWWTETIPCGLFAGRWTSIDQGMTQERPTGALSGASVRSKRLMTEETRGQLNRSISITCSLSLTERYSWHAALGTPNGPRLLLPASPDACLDLFKNRKKAEAERRRAALRHWVHQHYRQNSATGLAYVRNHLRGATNFEWYDMMGEIMVSEFDLEKNEFFKDEADQWRKQRKHNRVRVRLKDRRS